MAAGFVTASIIALLFNFDPVVQFHWQDPSMTAKDVIEIVWVHGSELPRNRLFGFCDYRRRCRSTMRGQARRPRCRSSCLMLPAGNLGAKRAMAKRRRVELSNLQELTGGSNAGGYGSLQRGERRARGVTLNNQTSARVILFSGAVGNTIISQGPVIDQGEMDNTIRRRPTNEPNLGIGSSRRFSCDVR